MKSNKANIRFIIFNISFLFVVGCSQTIEVGRTVWGTSTRALEDARVDAISQSYECTYQECFDAVVEVAMSDGVKKESDEEQTVHSGLFSIFHKNYVNGYIVVMDVPGNIDTTEVGIFFTRLRQKETKIDISSLSGSAKRKVAETLKKELSLRFSQIQ